MGPADGVDPDKMSQGCCRSLHVATGLRTGGDEESVLDLINVCRRRGRDDRLVVFEQDETRGLRDLPVSVVQRTGPWDRTLGLRMAEHAAPMAPSIIHAHDPQSLRVAVAAARLLKPSPKVVASFHRRPRGGWISRWFARRAVRRADAVTAATEGLAEELHGRRWVVGDVHVLGPGIDAEVYRPTGDADRWRERLGIPDNCTAVGFAGASNPAEVIEVHRELQKLSPGSHLVLVAPVTSRDSVATEIRTANDVHVLIRGNRAPFYRCLDGFAFGNGQASSTRLLHEAMASGVPTVIASTEHGKEFVTGSQGPAAMLVSPRSPERIAAGLKQLLDDARRIQLGHVARRRALEVGTAQENYADLERLYARVAPARRATADKAKPRERAFYRKKSGVGVGP